MNNYFMDIVSECEMPSKRQEYLLICDREVEALNISQKARDKIARLFGDTEANLLLDNANVVNNIFETMKVFIYVEGILLCSWLFHIWNFYTRCNKYFILFTMQELTKSDDRATAMFNLKNELREHIDKYFSAATHATR